MKIVRDPVTVLGIDNTASRETICLEKTNRKNEREVLNRRLNVEK